MKTTSKIQKTILTASVVAGLAFLGFSINAQEETNSLLENNGVKHLAMLTSRNINLPINIFSKTTGLTSTGSIAAYLVKETEEPLNVEDWMLNENNFSTFTEMETEAENPMEIESWMLNEKTFSLNSLFIETETDEQLKLEDWMLNESGFSGVELIEEETESPLEVENWTLDDNTFTAGTMVFETATDEQLKLEDWMLDENNFMNKTQEVSSNNSKSKGKVISTKNYIYQEVITESVLTIEDWMINPKTWNK